MKMVNANLACQDVSNAPVEIPAINVALTQMLTVANANVSLRLL
jgi:hypothetical protein